MEKTEWQVQQYGRPGVGIRLNPGILDDVDRTIETRLLSAAGEFREKLLKDPAGGRVHPPDLFDTNYQRTDGDKHANKASEYFAAEILPLLKTWAAAHANIIYVVAMDRNGFMPVYVMPGRTGVIMKDRVSALA
jgi:hypothetical protein